MKTSSRILPVSLSAFLLLTVSACRKEPHPGNTATRHTLAIQSDGPIKIHQALMVYDQTAELDSSLNRNIPNRDVYRYIVLPDSDAATWSSRFNGTVDISFSRSGSYWVTADIYDSTGRQLLRHTDTVGITVTTDTLYPAQPVYPDDELIITPGLAANASMDASKTTYYLQLAFATTRVYDYDPLNNQFGYTSDIHDNSYSFDFPDSIRLLSYPFAWGYGIKNKVTGLIGLFNLPIGTPADLSFTWLGRRYTGTVIQVSMYQYNFEWDNSGAVKIIH